MFRFYYFCPRCGRRHGYFLPRSKVKCRFCDEVWRPAKQKKGRKKPQVAFSVKYVFVWLVPLLFVLFHLWRSGAF